MGNTFGHLAGGVDAVEGEFGGRRTSAVCGSAFERREHDGGVPVFRDIPKDRLRSEEHTSELQSLMRISYAVFCLKKKKEAHTQMWSAYNRNTQYQIQNDTTSRRAI